MTADGPMTTEGPEKPLSVIRGMRGVVHAFYLDRTVLQQMREEEKKVRAVGDITVDNVGFSTALTRQHVIAIIKDPRFRPPPEPTVELCSSDNKIMGVEVFPFTAQKYLNRKDVVWLSDAFVMFPSVNGNGSEHFVMPCVSFPELNASNGCKDVVSCSPAPTCDLMMRKYYQYPDDPKLASVLVGFNEA
ncbi:MAG: hypothetical protein PHT00_03405 [Candidatus Methanomethylophilus sp.]|nr:hypothetical protein [Methanomethylophilus sp.]MDD3233200.1 hypothetical protein [Methanomethylophilus sp.]MDD4221757.1 hypothetical protein [Methanomethylophilus sp.]MDD4668801.1 hypothetical protein [Methanomethylophilus sp.]